MYGSCIFIVNFSSLYFVQDMLIFALPVTATICLCMWPNRLRSPERDMTWSTSLQFVLSKKSTDPNLSAIMRPSRTAMVSAWSSCKGNSNISLVIAEKSSYTGTVNWPRGITLSFNVPISDGPHHCNTGCGFTGLLMFSWANCPLLE